MENENPEIRRFLTLPILKMVIGSTGFSAMRSIRKRQTSKVTNTMPEPITTGWTHGKIFPPVVRNANKETSVKT
jgi:hypothetical protein